MNHKLSPDSEIRSEFQGKMYLVSLVWFSINKNLPNLFKLLLEKGASIKSTLFESLSISSFQEFCKKNGIDMKKLEIEGTNLMLLLTKDSKTDLKTLEALVEEGYDVNARHKDGSPFFHKLLYDSYSTKPVTVEFTKKLIEHGVDLKAKGPKGDAIWYIFSNSSINEKLFDYFLDNHFDPSTVNSQNEEGESLFHLFMKNYCGQSTRKNVKKTKKYFSIFYY